MKQSLNVEAYRNECTEQSLTGNNNLVDDRVFHTLGEMIIDQIEHKGGGEAMCFLLKRFGSFHDTCQTIKVSQMLP